MGGEADYLVFPTVKLNIFRQLNIPSRLISFFSRITNVHSRQELACVLSCAMMYDLESIQDQQTEASLWRNVFYQLIQYYRNKIVASNSGHFYMQKVHVVPTLELIILNLALKRLQIYNWNSPFL